jgi:hypothetical protein
MFTTDEEEFLHAEHCMDDDEGSSEFDPMEIMMREEERYF